MLVRFLTLREGSIIVVTLLTILYFSLSTEHFFTHANFINVLPYFAPFAILAAGEVLLMVAGEIDLSIGSVYLFAPFMFYQFDQAGLPLVANLILALLCSAVVGVINGVFVEIIGVSSFITTLGMLLGLGGLTLIISDAQPVAMPGAEVTTRTVDVTHIVNGQKIVLPEKVNEVGTFAKIFGAGAYSELIWALVIIIGAQVLLTMTRWGTYTIAVGGNRLGAAGGGHQRPPHRDPQLHPVQRLRRPGGRARGDPRRLGHARHRRRLGVDVPRRVGGGDRRHAARSAAWARRSGRCSARCSSASCATA